MKALVSPDSFGSILVLLIVTYALARWGQAGFNGAMGLAPFADGNALAFEVGTREILPIVKDIVTSSRGWLQAVLPELRSNPDPKIRAAFNSCFMNPPDTASAPAAFTCCQAASSASVLERT